MTSTQDRDAGHWTSQDWDAALDEAAHWSVLLAEDPEAPDVRVPFAAWLGQGLLQAQAWAHTDHVTGLIGQASGVAFLPATARARPAASHSLRYRPSARALAAVAAAALVAWLAGPTALVMATADRATGTAEESMLALADGSTVRLAPASAVKVDYGQGERRVSLLRGEAYFEVAPDPARPFRVAARSAQVTVLGTGFDVRLGEGGTEVAVRHGRVRVAAAAGSGQVRYLTAGQWAQVASDGAFGGGETSPASVAAWSGRRVVAIDRPLSEVIADVRRYYAGAIVVTSDRLRRASVTGSYDMTDPVAAIRAIVQPHGGTVRRITPWLVVVSA